MSGENGRCRICFDISIKSSARRRRIRAIFFERFVAKLMLGRGPNEEVVEKAMTKVMPPLFDYLESQLGDGNALVGKRFSIADVGIATQFVNLRHAGSGVDPKRWPKTAAWAGRFLAHPTIVKFMAEERSGLGLT